MNAERDCFDPAMRSMPASTSFEIVIEVFSFIPPSYYQSYSRYTTQRVAGFLTPNQKDFVLCLADLRQNRSRLGRRISRFRDGPSHHDMASPGGDRLRRCDDSNLIARTASGGTHSRINDGEVATELRAQCGGFPR